MMNEDIKHFKCNDGIIAHLLSLSSCKLTKRTICTLFILIAWDGHCPIFVLTLIYVCFLHHLHFSLFIFAYIQSQD